MRGYFTRTIPLGRREGGGRGDRGVASMVELKRTLHIENVLTEHSVHRRRRGPVEASGGFCDCVYAPRDRMSIEFVIVGWLR